MPEPLVVRIREVELIRSKGDALDPDQVVTEPRAPDGIDLIDRGEVEVADEGQVTGALCASRPDDEVGEVDDRVAMLFGSIAEQAGFASAFPTPSTTRLANAATHLATN